MDEIMEQSQREDYTLEKLLDNGLFDAFSSASDNIFVYVTDLKTDLTRWSKRAVDYFGLPGEYIHGTANLWIEKVHPEDREGYLGDLMPVLTGKSTQHSYQYRARTRYGDYVWVECKGSVINDAEGNPSIFAGLMTRLDNHHKYDALTHLLTIYELQKQDFQNTDGALMLVGVDGFRNINSQHGIIYGNNLLVWLAKFITGHVGSDCKVFRMQGDEFAVYAEGRTAGYMSSVFQKVEADCSTASVAETGVAPFSISAGVVRFPQDGEDFSTILGNAERSVEHAKKQSNSHIAIYSQEINEKHNRRNLIAEALMESIKNDFQGFELYYQPLVDNDNQTVIGCEALLRWNSGSEEIGPCYPGEFIPILESNGAIVQVGYFVMREAIRQAAQWQKKYKSFRVSFNVSYLQMEDPFFIPEFIETAEKEQVDPKRVVMELTESVIAADKTTVRSSFDALHRRGFRIALDDFGTGNSSFALLHDIDVDIIKLDQSFIRGLCADGNPLDYAIVESIAFLCNRIQMMTIAEGIENEELWNRIKEFGFTALQGYHFSRPIPKQQFEEFLDKYGMLQ